MSVLLLCYGLKAGEETISSLIDTFLRLIVHEN